jgi:hypothetical protein
MTFNALPSQIMLGNPISLALDSANKAAFASAFDGLHNSIESVHTAIISPLWSLITCLYYCGFGSFYFLPCTHLE